MKRVHSLLLFFTFLLLLSAGAGADQKQLRFDLDYARFRTSSDFVYLEIYYSIYRDQLQFVPDGDRFRADFRIDSSIFLKDSLVVRDTLHNVTIVDSLSQVTSSQRLADLSGIIIRPGEYHLQVVITDIHTKKSGLIETDLQILPIVADQLAMSDIQLASLIEPFKGKTKFVKNNYRVIPNPNSIYGTGAPVLYFYSEIYNLKPNGDKNQYRSKYLLLDGNGNEIRALQDKLKDKPGSSSVEIAGFNIISLHSGIYYLRVEVQDVDSDEKITAIKKFFVYRPDDYRNKTVSNTTKFSPEDYLNSPQYQTYDTMDEKDLQSEFSGARYIAAANERKIFKSLDLTGKRNFIKRFWLKRDDNLSTIQNKFMAQYLNRLKFANEHFGSGKPGWKSDRGRVLLIYGKSDEIERIPNSSDTNPYEIWHYFNIQGGVDFIFVDIRGFGDYILVHSTARNELQDYDWQRWIRKQ